METMIIWQTRPDTHLAAQEQLLDVGVEHPGVEVISHHHGIGIGFMLVKSQALEPVYKMCSSWAHLVLIETHVVMGHDRALAALRDLHGRS